MSTRVGTLSMVALLFAAAAALALTPTSGEWSGQSSQKRSVSFTVMPAQARGARNEVCDAAACLFTFAVNVKVKCPPRYRGGSGLIILGTARWMARPKFVKVSPSGRFSLIGGKTALGIINLVGRFTSATQAKGTVKLTSAAKGCPEPTYSWTAKLRE